jgi:hypothetical protein
MNSRYGSVFMRSAKEITDSNKINMKVLNFPRVKRRRKAKSSKRKRKRSDKG